MNQEKLLQVFEARYCKVTGHNSLLNAHHTQTQTHTETASQLQLNHSISFNNGLVNYMSHFILLATCLKIPTEAPSR